MSTSQLALLGGTPVRSKPFPLYNTVGPEERAAVLDVLDSGVLSKYLGTWSPDFHGGPRVQELEKAWADHFGARHAITMNSATSGLYASVGACDVGPGDEVIVSPYTMSASAAGPLVYGARPVFADILPDTFCLDPESVRRCLTPRTRAIVVVDLFGHPAEMDEIMALARAHRLRVIEDAAQAPGATYRGRWAGTLGDIGVFSLNYHKTIHTGEGGVVVTDDDELAERLKLIRNHAEVVVQQSKDTRFGGLLGFNYRMTEIEAAIGREQLRKLDTLTGPRVDAAARLSEHLAGLPGITAPMVRPYVRHVFYVYGVRYDAAHVGVSRAMFADALRAEGIPVGTGYVEPIYLQPIYRRRFPDRTEEYAPGLCPVTERMHRHELLTLSVCYTGITDDDLADVSVAFRKVLAGGRALRTRELASR